MSKSALFAVLIAGATELPPSAQAAPLDALLSANKKTDPGSMDIEAAYDVMNSTVDIFKVRDRDNAFSGTNIGDYHGGHIHAGIAVTPRLWVDGSLWQRRIDYRQNQAKIQSWQLAGQYKLSESEKHRPALALRLNAWGNRADRLEKASATTFQGISLSSVKVDYPKDWQLQFDLIASWSVLDSLEVSSFAGAGTSEVKIGAITGTARQNGCSYNLAFTSDKLVGTLAQPCGGSVVVERFSVPNSVSGVNVYDETQYRANYLHGGLSATWRSGSWKLGAGYQYQVLRRHNIDDVIERRGGTATKDNHILIGEIAYRATRTLSLFCRGQYMTHQFTGEIPFAYNTLTAARFKNRYGILSIGILTEFQ